MVFFPGYIHFYNLTEADIFHKAHIENPVLSDQLANIENKLEAGEHVNGFQIILENSTPIICSFLIQELPQLKDISPLRC
jgi:hypothetical protein